MLPLLVQAASSAAQTPVDDFSPMQLFLLCLLVGCFVLVFLIEAGVVAFLAGAFFCVACGVFLGICASSAVIGLVRGRFGAFFHALCVQAAGVFGLGLGLAGGVAARLLDASLGWSKPLGCGAGIGFLAGLLAGHLLAKACRLAVGKITA